MLVSAVIYQARQRDGAVVPNMVLSPEKLEQFKDTTLYFVLMLSLYIAVGVSALGMLILPCYCWYRKEKREEDSEEVSLEMTAPAGTDDDQYDPRWSGVPKPEF